MRRVALLASCFVACGPCTRDDAAIAKDRTADGALLPRSIAPYDLFDRDAAVDGEQVQMVAVVDAQDPPHAIALGMAIVPLADGAIPAAAARAISGHHKVRLRGTVRRVGAQATLAVDHVEDVPSALRPLTLAELDANPLAFDEAHVVLTGVHVVGEEKSVLGDVVWLSGCPSPDAGAAQRARVEGWLFTHPHGAGGFGHTNAYRYALVADRCETP